MTKTPTRDANVLYDKPTKHTNHIDCVEMVNMAPDSIVVTNGNGECMKYFFLSHSFFGEKRIHLLLKVSE